MPTDMPPGKPYCVIGLTAINRRWVETEQEAALHAVQLFRTYQPSVLYVVRAQLVVGPTYPPVAVINIDTGEQMPVTYGTMKTPWDKKDA